MSKPKVPESAELEGMLKAFPHPVIVTLQLSTYIS
jgi:hypothetical protein